MYGVRPRNPPSTTDAIHGVPTETCIAMSQYPIRKTIRLKNYDYRSKGVYHVTICAIYRDTIFGRVENGCMVLNDLGRVVEQKIGELPGHYAECDVIASVVMPNHVHLLVGLAMAADAIHGVPTAKHTLGQIIGAYKASVSRAVGRTVWQPRYYEHIIRGDVDLQQTYEYIQNNPAAWDRDELFIPTDPAHFP